MTKSRLLIVLFMIWFLSIRIAVLHWVNIADCHKSKKVTLAILRIIISALWLGISKYTNDIRKKQIKEIMRSKKYFGAEKEKLDKYQMLKNTSIDAFKFYIVTIIVLFLWKSGHFYWSWIPTYQSVSYFTTTFYMVFSCYLDTAWLEGSI